MRKLIPILLALFACMPVTKAVTPDSAYVRRHSIWRLTDIDALRNPALMTHAYQNSLTELSVTMDGWRQSETFRMEQGSGLLRPEIAARSYIRLTPMSVVWGEAGYSNGKHWNRQFNNVADFDLLYPDIIADSIGGDTREERYIFSGGYAKEQGNWLLGGELRFRAEQEYRNYDPRMRSIVSDLTLKAGAARTISHYRMGVSAEGNIYRQTADVDFYGEANGMGEWQMTGLGTNYVRFSGSNRDIFYEGKGGAVTLDILPVAEKGWIAHLSHALHQYERLSDEYNSLPLTTLYHQKTDLIIGWKQQTTTDRKALMLNASYDKRASDEHVVGTATGQDYPILTDLTMYQQHQWDVSLAGIYGRHGGLFLAKAGFLNHRERYAWPERKMDYARLYAALTAQWLKAVGKNLRLNMFAHGDYAANISHQIVMPYALMTACIREYIDHNHKYQKANYARIGTGIRADYKKNTWAIGLFGQLAAGWCYCDEGEHEGRLKIELGINF